MADALFSGPYFCIGLTLGAYALGAAIQKKWRSPLLNPILLASLLIIGVLLVLDVPNQVYQEGCRLLKHLMTPSTVCLAISFYEQFEKVKKHLGAVLIGVLAGTVCCLGFIFLGCQVMGLSRELTVSLLPKSITTAIGVSLCQELGGISAIATCSIITTGILGNVLGPGLCRALKLRSQVAQGAAFGTASHVIGTSRAVEIGGLAGAVGSLSLTLAGLMTVVILSCLAQFL